MTCDHGDIYEDVKNLTEVVKTLQNRFVYHISYNCACEELRSKLDRMQTQINGLVISRDHQSAQNKQFMETLDAHITNTVSEGKKRTCYICGCVNPTYHSTYNFKLVCRDCVMKLYDVMNGCGPGQC